MKLNKKIGFTLNFEDGSGGVNIGLHPSDDEGKLTIKVTKWSASERSLSKNALGTRSE